MGKLISKGFFAKKASLVAPKLLGLKLCTSAVSVGLCEVEAYEGKNDEASHAYTLTERSKIMHETYAHWYVYFIYGNHHCLNITCGKNEAGAVLIREAIPLKGIELMRKRRKLDACQKNNKPKQKTSNKHQQKTSSNALPGIKGICDGPGKLCAALGIDKNFNGLALGEKLWLEKMNSKEKKLFTKLLQHNKIGGLNSLQKRKKNKKPKLKLIAKKPGLKVNTKKSKLKIIALPRVGISKAKEKKWRFKYGVRDN